MNGSMLSVPSNPLDTYTSTSTCSSLKSLYEQRLLPWQPHVTLPQPAAMSFVKIESTKHNLSEGSWQFCFGACRHLGSYPVRMQAAGVVIGLSVCLSMEFQQ